MHEAWTNAPWRRGAGRRLCLHPWPLPLLTPLAPGKQPVVMGMFMSKPWAFEAATTMAEVSFWQKIGEQSRENDLSLSGSPKDAIGVDCCLGLSTGTEAELRDPSSLPTPPLPPPPQGKAKPWDSCWVLAKTGRWALSRGFELRGDSAPPQGAHVPGPWGNGLCRPVHQAQLPDAVGNSL